jgi:TolA-binding protein
MKRRWSVVSAFVALVLAAFLIPPAFAIDEPERLWLVGESAFADGLYPLARRTLERFVERYPGDPRVPKALAMLGRSRLTLGEVEGALDAIRRAQAMSPSPAEAHELRFWEAEALFRLKRYVEARSAYDDVIRTDASVPFAADALYGYGWAELELKRPEPAVTAFREFLQTWAQHPHAASATYHLARALVELKRYAEALPLLTTFPGKYPKDRLAPDAEYLLAWTRLQSGDTRNGLAEMRRFVDANPNHPQAAEGRKLIAKAMPKTGTRSELQETYTALIQQSPASAESLAEAVTVGSRLSRKEQDAAWKKLRAEFPDDPVTHKTALDLATAAFKRKDWKEAAQYAEVAAKTDDDGVRAEAWLLAGESDLKLKRFPAAAKAFEAVGAGTNVDASVRFRALAGLGLAREEQKDWRAALTAYESVAAKSPDPSLREWARERAAFVKTRLGQPAPKSKGRS